VLLICGAASGCTNAASQVRQSEYDVGGPPTIELAQHGGLYNIQWRKSIGDGWHMLDGSARIISPGDRVGFETSGCDAVTAVVAGERFVLEHLPADAQSCAWVTTPMCSSPPATPLDETKMRGVAWFLADVAFRWAVLSRVTGPIPPEAQTVRLP